MSRILVLGFIALAVMSPAAALSQVVEIDGSGSITIYDRPMIFTNSGAALIVSPEVKSTVAPVPASKMLEDVWPRIESQALRHGLPPSLLQALAWQESRGRTTAVSSKGALGVMQLMPATAAAMGVDPSNPDDNLRGGAMYLRRLLDRFGSVPLALAAYNAGPGAVTRFGGLPPYRETRAYVESIMARWRPQDAATLSSNNLGSPSS
ncbi:lytic transglycosylase domain-containing protein [Polymorphobacter multimanifer]|uniref:lytic transglycosylase domain-containing protein n=1 Tax=Polymorphobacter multimanifer TaxID=1070431 RepID=UPI00161CA42C|nr:lytic transglycosylase domain-containing protein [Polymorphobacter multimanifer]